MSRDRFHTAHCWVMYGLTLIFTIYIIYRVICSALFHDHFGIHLYLDTEIETKDATESRLWFNYDLTANFLAQTLAVVQTEAVALQFTVLCWDIPSLAIWCEYILYITSAHSYPLVFNLDCNFCRFHFVSWFYGRSDEHRRVEWRKLYSIWHKIEQDVA